MSPFLRLCASRVGTSDPARCRRTAPATRTRRADRPRRRSASIRPPMRGAPWPMSTKMLPSHKSKCTRTGLHLSQHRRLGREQFPDLRCRAGQRDGEPGGVGQDRVGHLQERRPPARSQRRRRVAEPAPGDRVHDRYLATDPGTQLVVLTPARRRPQQVPWPARAFGHHQMPAGHDAAAGIYSRYRGHRHAGEPVVHRLGAKIPRSYPQHRPAAIGSGSLPCLWQRTGLVPMVAAGLREVRSAGRVLASTGRAGCA
jgi:hypothetical protein